MQKDNFVREADKYPPEFSCVISDVHFMNAIDMCIHTHVAIMEEILKDVNINRTFVKLHVCRFLQHYKTK